MKRLLLCLLLLVFVAVPALAQNTVSGTNPANNGTNVPVQTVLKLWFTSPIDTTAAFGQFSGYFTSIDTIMGQWYSTNSDTVYLNVRLAPSTAYFMAIYWLPGTGGGELANPFLYSFTTGSSFTGTTVSGTVFSNSGGVSPAHTLVALSSNSPVNQTPIFVAGTVADGSGAFTIPHVPNGTFYPVGAKDATGDGGIDPGKGDAVAIGAPINVTGSPITGLSLTLVQGQSMTYSAGLDSATGYQSAHLPGAELRFVQSYDSDSLGRSLNNWDFDYYNPSVDTSTEVAVQSFGIGVRSTDPYTKSMVRQVRTIPSPASAVDPSVFIANVEAGGGLAFRTQQVPGNYVFQRSLFLGQLTYRIPTSLIPDTTQFYWAAQYQFSIQYTQDSSQTILQQWYLGSFSSGAVLAGVDPTGKNVPTEYSLTQNYPNPFNPSTKIAYALPVQSSVRLEVFNLLGQKVATLVDGEQHAGPQQVEWRPAVSSGIYLYKMTAISSANPNKVFTQVKKMILMK